MAYTVHTVHTVHTVYTVYTTLRGRFTNDKNHKS